MTKRMLTELPVTVSKAYHMPHRPLTARQVKIQVKVLPAVPSDQRAADGEANRAQKQVYHWFWVSYSTARVTRSQRPVPRTLSVESGKRQAYQLTIAFPLRRSVAARRHEQKNSDQNGRWIIAILIANFGHGATDCAGGN
jgi:hypothetical protein